VSESDSSGQRHSTWTSGTEILRAGFAAGSCTLQTETRPGMPLVSTCVNNDGGISRDVLSYRSGAAPPAGYHFHSQAFGRELLGQADDAVQYFQEAFGAFPYKRLSLSMLPSVAASSSPALVYAGTIPFLSSEHRQVLGLAGADLTESERLFAREIARQWF